MALYLSTKEEADEWERPPHRAAEFLCGYADAIVIWYLLTNPLPAHYDASRSAPCPAGGPGDETWRRLIVDNLDDTGRLTARKEEAQVSEAP